MSDTREKLSTVTIVLHWLIAVTMIGMVFFGMYLEDLPRSAPEKLPLINLHKSIGMIALVVIAWRVVRRLSIGLPEHVGTYPAWQSNLAVITHYALLAATLGLPVTGLLFSIGAGHPIAVFGLEVIPKFPRNGDLLAFARAAHAILGKVVLALVVLHVAGALKHHVLDKDGTLKRMLGARVVPLRHM